MKRGAIRSHDLQKFDKEAGWSPKEVMKARLSFTFTVSHISSLCCTPALLTNEPPWYLCCVAKLLENICAQSFQCYRFQRPALARDEKTLKCTVEIGRARKSTILFLTSLIGPFGFSAVFSLAFNHTVYNCAYNQNPCRWTLVSSCYSALLKIVSIFCDDIIQQLPPMFSH